MEDITRKQMKDVIVPQNDVIRRPQTMPLQYVEQVSSNAGDRIGKSPFFEKPKNKSLEPKKAHSTGQNIFFALLFALLLAVGFFVANYFAMATIEITPITRSVQINNNFTATIGDSDEELMFHFTSLSEEKKKEVPATIEKKIQKKASGMVTIYNAYSGDSQRLIKNTRLEDDVTHKIFRIDQSVVVPGAKVVNGKTVPGSVDALVYADVSGKEYNIGTSNFTIPGFKGDPRYSKFYAASIPSSPITGGFSGTVKVPSDESIKTAQEELKQDLKISVVEKARAQIPTEASFFPGSIVVKFEEVPEDPTISEISNVTMRAVVSVFFFDTAELTEMLAELLPVEDRNNPFKITNMSALVFKFIDPVDDVVLSDLKKISFNLTGNTSLVGEIDSKKISSDFAGKKKNETNEIIKKQINIEDANVTVRPVWKKLFPDDPSKITVKIIKK